MIEQRVASVVLWVIIDVCQLAPSLLIIYSIPSVIFLHFCFRPLVIGLMSRSVPPLSVFTTKPDISSHTERPLKASATADFCLLTSPWLPIGRYHRYGHHDHHYPRRLPQRGRVFTSVCLCVCKLFFSTASQKPIAKLDTEMFHDKSWKTVQFGIRRSKVEVANHKDIAGVDLCTLVSAGFF